MERRTIVMKEYSLLLSLQMVAETLSFFFFFFFNQGLGPIAEIMADYLLELKLNKSSLY